MNATNWARCPKCRKNEKPIAYGESTEEEYLARLTEVIWGVSRPKLTLREDYESFFNDKGEFTTYYRCMCEKCGFTFSFEHHDKGALG